MIPRRLSTTTLLALLIWPAFTSATTIEVTQRETVTLTIKLVNTTEQVRRGLSVALDIESTPTWIHSTGEGSRLATIPAKRTARQRPSARLPLTFAVSPDAPPGAEVALQVMIRDNVGQIWRRPVQIRVSPPKPQHDRLMPNYPNPFNPETWIPYQLKDTARVKIHIFDSLGRQVRSLDLGQKPAGSYISKTQAGYWDGRNEAGELVSSGLYFFQIDTERFSSIRKMVVVK